LKKTKKRKGLEETSTLPQESTKKKQKRNMLWMDFEDFEEENEGNNETTSEKKKRPNQMKLESINYLKNLQIVLNPLTLISFLVLRSWKVLDWRKLSLNLRN